MRETSSWTRGTSQPWPSGHRENVEHVVRAAGETKADIVNFAAFLTDARNFPDYNDVRRAFFGNRFPASTSVVVKELARPEYLLEIEAMAVIGGQTSD